MDLQTYLMIKAANSQLEGYSRWGTPLSGMNGPGLMPNYGLRYDPYVMGLPAPRGTLMGIGPNGKTTYMEGPPIINRGMPINYRSMPNQLFKLLRRVH